MDLDEDDLPTFRPFTRDELATIENRIYEDKLAAKKKAERRDRNIAEFGEGARARKMYENDTDDEEDDDEKITEPNPKLAQGTYNFFSWNQFHDIFIAAWHLFVKLITWKKNPDNRLLLSSQLQFLIILSIYSLGNDLPRRFGQFPEHLASVPIVDIDPYYRDKKTFIVLSNKGSIFRFFAGKALFVLSPFHPIRRIAIRVLVHPIFSLIVILTILANCYVMILPDSE